MSDNLENDIKARKCIEKVGGGRDDGGRHGSWWGGVANEGGKLVEEDMLDLLYGDGKLEIKEEGGFNKNIFI